jgi:hypothetical protein
LKPQSGPRRRRPEKFGGNERCEGARQEDKRGDDARSRRLDVPGDGERPDPVDAREADVAEENDAEYEDSEARAGPEGEEREEEGERDHEDPVVERERNLGQMLEGDAETPEPASEEAWMQQRAEAVVRG